MNQIVFELCAEDRARLDAIIGGLAALAGPAKKEAPAAAPVDLPAPVEAPAPAAEGGKKYALADVQGLFVKVIAAGKKPAATEILHDYAEAVTLIPEDKYAEVMARLARL